MEFRILGHVEARRGGDEVPLGGPKVRALLAILLLDANRIVSRDRLIDGLWGERPPPSAAHTLDDNISRLRRALGPERIERRAPGYRLRVDPGELDLERFEQAFRAGREALAGGDPAKASRLLDASLQLWRAPALADVLFEPFAREQAEALEERRLLALEERAEAALATGQDGELVPDLERLVHENPLRERLRAQLMLALYRAGRQAEALALFEAARLRFAEHLGLEPGPLLRSRQAEILNHDPGLARPATAQPRRPQRPRLRRRVALASLAVAIAVIALIGTQLGGKPPSAKAVTTNQLLALNPGSGMAMHAVPLAGAPSAVAGDGESLWLADPSAGVVSRVDPGARAVSERIALGGNPGVVAVGGGSVWVAGLPGASITRIDPATEAVTQTIHLGGASAAALAFGQGGLWIADTADDALIQLDAVTGAARRSLELDLHPTAITIGSGAIWVADYAASSVAEIDPDSGRTLATIHVPSGPVALAAGAGALWVASSLDSTVSRIDPARGSIVATIPVGSGPAALVVANGSVWVANQYSGTVSRIDVERNTVASSTSVGGVPATITSAAGKLWVSVRPRIQHRGGTLVLLHTHAISIDPAVESGVPPLQGLGLTSDGLVTYNHVAGPGGLQLVPDLAITLPTPTGGGMTYTFLLRPGIRYSDGRRVLASDFRREIERVLRIGSLDRDLVSGIVGASTCVTRHASACDLSQGVIADDPAATVTFRLTGPDPQFLAKLANGGVSFPVPPGTPSRGSGLTPIPGTGPYKIETADRHHIRYVRNPLFREWSHAAQPDGNPDEIIWRFGLSATEEVRTIQEGRADWSGDPIPGSLLHDLRTRFASQVRSYPTTDTEFLQFNTTLAPFSDVRVREAFNLALDRNAIVRLWGGPDAAQPTCQLLPPGVPGYSRYCPYTRSPALDGAWKSPDLARARRLVEASGTHGARVTVWGWTDDSFAPPSEVRYAARVLRSLGYRARVRLVTHAFLAHPPERVFAGIQVIPTGWSDVTAYSFFAPWLSCDGAGDHGWFCIPRIDGAMRAARARESSAPRAASRIWMRIDHEIVDRAALVPLVNPRQIEFSSKRVRNFQQHPFLNLIADQVWLT